MNEENCETNIWGISQQPCNVTSFYNNDVLSEVKFDFIDSCVAENNVDISSHKNCEDDFEMKFEDIKSELVESRPSEDNSLKRENIIPACITLVENIKSEECPPENIKEIYTAPSAVPLNLLIMPVKNAALADLMKSVQMPVIRLERLQFNASKKKSSVADLSSQEKCSIENVIHQPTQKEVTVTTEEPWNKCSVCDKAFTTKSILEKHEEIHSGENSSFQCSSCENVFISSDHLKRHELKYHKITQPESSSGEKSRPHRRKVVTDKKSETGETLYKCSFPYCRKVFFAPEVLKVHERVHTGEQPFECSICKKSFSQSGELIRHQNLHKKPIKCSFCDKYFAQDEIKLHERVHLGEKPYKCSVCGISFLQPIQLKVHKRSHTGEKTHKCSRCLMSFFKRSELIDHQKQHAEQKCYKCPTCDKEFLHASSMQRHTKNQHGAANTINILGI